MHFVLIAAEATSRTLRIMEISLSAKFNNHGSRDKFGEGSALRLPHIRVPSALFDRACCASHRHRGTGMTAPKREAVPARRRWPSLESASIYRGVGDPPCPAQAPADSLVDADRSYTNALAHQPDPSIQSYLPPRGGDTGPDSWNTSIIVDKFRRHTARWFFMLGTVTLYYLANITPDSAEVLKRKQGTFQGCIAEPAGRGGKLRWVRRLHHRIFVSLMTIRSALFTQLNLHTNGPPLRRRVASECPPHYRYHTRSTRTA